jgi:hypothetical protein
MHIAELVARHACDERRPSVAIVVRPSAEALAKVLPGGPVVQSWDERIPDEPGTRTLVEVVAPGSETGQIADLSAVLGETDVALLLFKPPPELLAVGVVTDVLTRHGLTILDACGTIHRLGRTAIVVSRDGERRQRVYLTGTPVPEDEAGRLRQRNEWAVEGLQLRSSRALLERRLEGQAQELLLAREEHRLLDQKISVMEGEQAAAQEALAASQRSLVAARQEIAVRPSRVRKAVRLLAEDPRAGSGRIARGIARRWRR